jgi:hypothetical protein
MPVVGEGTFGCVHSPSLKCKTKKNRNYDNKVSKLLTAEDARDELKELSLFKKIDKLEEHYLGYPKKCKPMDDEETKQEIEKCRDGMKFIEQYKKLRLLVMENGGVSLDDYVYSLYSKRYNEETTKHTEIMFLNMLNVLRGVKFLIDNKLSHKDLKGPNIVFNEGTRTMKMIDFGMLQNFEDMKKDALGDEYWPSQLWWSVPIYAELMNKTNYERLQNLFNNDENQILEYIKDLMRKVINNIGSVNSGFFKELTKTPSIIKKYMFNELKKSLKMIITKPHVEFVDQFCKINDIHNMGFTLLMILRRLEPDYEMKKTNVILSKKFIDDVHALGVRMISYDFFNHIEIDEVLREYERILNTSKFVERNGYMITKDKKAKIKRGSPIVKLDVLLVNARSSRSVQGKSLQQCLEGYERNPKTSRCIKVCKTGYTRDENFKCKSLNPRGRPRKSVLKTSKTRKICNDGKELNPKTNRCVKKCNDGYSRNDVFKCVKTKKNRLS